MQTQQPGIVQLGKRRPLLGQLLEACCMAFLELVFAFRSLLFACSSHSWRLPFLWIITPPKYIPKENIFKSLSEGVRFVWGNKMMLSVLSLDLFSVFFGGAVALMPVFANDILKVGSEGLGLLRAAPSLGAVLTMAAMTYYSPMGKPWRNLLFAVTGFGISIICFGLSKNFYLSLIFLFFEGAFDSISVIIRSTILQILTPEEMRGRVSAVNSMFIGSSNEIGSFESGVTARLMGTVPAVVFGGSMTLLIVVFTYLKTKTGSYLKNQIL